MKVRAIAKGFHGGRRRVGDVFDVPDDSKATWYEPVVEPKVDKAEKKPKADTKAPDPKPDASKPADDLA